MSERYYIVASSFVHAHTTATIDWGWRRGPMNTWFDHEGREVRYLANAEQLQGTRGARIYQGFEWWANPRLDGLAAGMRYTRAEFVPGPRSEQRPTAPHGVRARP